MIQQAIHIWWQVISYLCPLNCFQTNHQDCNRVLPFPIMLLSMECLHLNNACFPPFFPALIHLFHNVWTRDLLFCYVAHYTFRGGNSSIIDVVSVSMDFMRNPIRSDPLLPKYGKLRRLLHQCSGICGTPLKRGKNKFGHYRVCPQMMYRIYDDHSGTVVGHHHA